MSNKFVPSFHTFRWYEDGTETGSTALGAIDAAITGRSVDSDSQVQLRIGVEEIGDGSVAGESTDDWQLQFRKNGGGAFSNVTGSSLNVKSDSGSSLTDGDPTTDRVTDGITDGGGTFFAGIIEASDSEITDFTHQADNFTEHIFTLILVSADLADTDFLDFRLRRNGSAVGDTVTPRVTVSKVAAGRRRSNTT